MVASLVKVWCHPGGDCYWEGGSQDGHVKGLDGHTIDLRWKKMCARGWWVFIGCKIDGKSIAEKTKVFFHNIFFFPFIFSACQGIYTYVQGIKESPKLQNPEVYKASMKEIASVVIKSPAWTTTLASRPSKNIEKTGWSFRVRCFCVR